MAKFQRHVFICTRNRGEGHPRGCCSSKGSDELVSALKSGVVERGLRRVVRAQEAGCLDQCTRGATMVVYPEGTWYGAVTREDVDEIIDSHLVQGRAVDRLIIPDDQLTGKTPGE